MGLEFISQPQVFTATVCALDLKATNIVYTNLTSVASLSVSNDPIVGLGVVASNYVHTNSLTAVTLTASDVIYAQGGNSQLWNTAHSLVQANSASWEESAEVLPTVTNYLSTSNVVISSVRVTNYQISSILISNIIFSDGDSGKSFQLNTTVAPAVTAQFPGDLQDGFNVSIINAGTGTIFLSSASPLNASGSENSTPYSGMFIYKTNNELFGVGVFV